MKLVFSPANLHSYWIYINSHRLQIISAAMS